MNVRLLIAAIALTAGTALAFTPPTDDQVNGLIDKVKAIATPTDPKDTEGRAAASKARAEAVREGLKDISLAEASLPQIEKLYESRIIAGNSDALTALVPRLIELSKASGIPGARAAELRLIMAPPFIAPAAAGQPTAEDRAKATEARYKAMLPALLDALNNPAVVDLVKSGKGDSLIARVAGFPGPVLKEQNLLAKVEPLMVPEMSLEAAAGMGGLIRRLSEAELGLSKQEQVRILDKIAAAADGVLARVGTVPPEKEAIAKRVADVSKSAKSKFNRGEFIDSPAPEIAFTWASDGKLKSISELKGNVVVVDFWATWCGPCVASFPHVRDLVARYEAAGSPVRVIGVTSLQGFHMKRTQDLSVKAERIDCKGDAEKEYSMMPEFMKTMNMTWTVGFTPDGCFNPNYGVNGIPHLAIIDATGKVRHNALHPMHAKDVADKIDALLKEANLKAPAEPMADPEKEKDKKVGLAK